MKVVFDRSFHKRLLKVTDKAVLEKVRHVIISTEEATDIGAIPNLKKMEGFKTFYRIRIGDYRIGIEVKKDIVSFITIAHRKDIYKKFP